MSGRRTFALCLSAVMALTGVAGLGQAEAARRKGVGGKAVRKTAKQVRRQNKQRARGRQANAANASGSVTSQSVIVVPFERFALELRMDQQLYDNDDPAPVTLVVRNNTDRNQPLVFSSGQKFEFELLQSGRVLENWSNDKAFTQAFESFELKPGQSVEYSGALDMQRNDGGEIDPGEYIVRGYLTCISEESLVVENRIKVTD